MSNHYPKWQGVDYLVSLTLDPMPEITNGIVPGYVVSIYSKWDPDAELVHNLWNMPGFSKLSQRSSFMLLYQVIEASFVFETGSSLETLIDEIELEITDFEKRRLAASAK